MLQGFWAFETQGIYFADRIPEIDGFGFDGFSEMLRRGDRGNEGLRRYERDAAGDDVVTELRVLKIPEFADGHITSERFQETPRRRGFERVFVPRDHLVIMSDVDVLKRISESRERIAVVRAQTFPRTEMSGYLEGVPFGIVRYGESYGRSCPRMTAMPAESRFFGRWIRSSSIVRIVAAPRRHVQNPQERGVRTSPVFRVVVPAADVHTPKVHRDVRSFLKRMVSTKRSHLRTSMHDPAFSIQGLPSMPTPSTAPTTVPTAAPTTVPTAAQVPVTVPTAILPFVQDKTKFFSALQRIHATNGGLTFPNDDSTFKIMIRNDPEGGAGKFMVFDLVIIAPEDEERVIEVLELEHEGWWDEDDDSAFVVESWEFDKKVPDDDELTEMVDYVNKVHGYKICPCAKYFIKDGRDLCYFCELTATDTSMHREACPICISDGYAMHMKTTSCCSQKVHTECARAWSLKGGTNTCALCRAPTSDIRRTIRADRVVVQFDDSMLEDLVGRIARAANAINDSDDDSDDVRDTQDFPGSPDDCPSDPPDDCPV